MNILAIDFGTKKFGLAIYILGIAIPYGSILYTNYDEIIKKIKEIIKDENISKILLGLPLNEKGNDTERSLIIRDFYKNLCIKIDNIEIILIDEKNTTKESISLLKEYGYNNKKIKSSKDSLSAMNILNRYLGK